MEKPLALDHIPPVIGHRGAAGHAPENTLASLQKAAELGARWVEFDLKLTEDGTIVLFHDESLDRTTDGTGPIAAKTWAEIARLDAGRWFGAGFAGERVPRFEEAIETLSRLGLGANLEIKPCPGRERETGDAIARATRRHWPSHLPVPLLSSFDAGALEAAREACAEIPRGLLLDRLDPGWPDLFSRLGGSTLNVAERVLDATAIGAIRSVRTAASLPLLSFTVNRRERAAELFALGVDAVFSDFPERMAGFGGR